MRRTCAPARVVVRRAPGYSAHGHSPSCRDLTWPWPPVLKERKVPVRSVPPAPRGARGNTPMGWSRGTPRG
jgi:hypothetical protein